MTWCEEWPDPPWWRKLLWRIFPWTKPKHEFKTITLPVMKAGVPNANGNVYSEESLQKVILQDSMTERCLGESGFSMIVVSSQKGKKRAS